MRRGRRAPWYCATKVVRYPAVPWKSAISDQVVKSPVTAPATASGPYQVRNSRSRKTWTVKTMWLRMSG